MTIYLYNMLYICIKFQGNRVRIFCFVTNFEKWVERIILAPRAHWRPLKNEKIKIFFENLLAHISDMFKEIFFIFEMWPPLSGGYLHCKLSPIWIRHYLATYVWNCNFVVPINIYTYSIIVQPVFLGHKTHYHVSWYHW